MVEKLTIEELLTVLKRKLPEGIEVRVIGGFVPKAPEKPEMEECREFTKETYRSVAETVEYLEGMISMAGLKNKLASGEIKGHKVGNNRNSPWSVLSASACDWKWKNKAFGQD